MLDDSSMIFPETPHFSGRVVHHVSQTVKSYKNVPKSLKDLGKAIDRLNKQKILTQLAKRR